MPDRRVQNVTFNNATRCTDLYHTGSGGRHAAGEESIPERLEVRTEAEKYTARA